jgi:polysaccharide export outer membrane protein
MAMVLMDKMIKNLKVVFVVLGLMFIIPMGAQVSAAGKVDPLSIVSDTDRLAPDAEVLQVESQQNIDSMPLGNGYVIGASDKLRVTVYGEKELSKVYQVDGLGMVSIPLVGQVKLSGMTLKQAEDLLIVALSNGYLVDPSVAIEVAEFRPFYILGEVRRPGSYSYIDGMSVLNAVAISGGFTYRANSKSIEVIRSDVTGGAVRVPPTAQVLPGDIIRVKERFF